MRTTCRDEHGGSRLIPDASIQDCLDSLHAHNFLHPITVRTRRGVVLKKGVSLMRAIDILCVIEEAEFGPLTIKSNYDRWDQGPRCRECDLFCYGPHGAGGIGTCQKDGTERYGASGACGERVPRGREAGHGL